MLETCNAVFEVFNICYIRSVERFSISFEERQRLFHTELVRVGIDFHQAKKVANLLAKDLD
ncbi:MAG TPA: hypothetical protein V6C65_21550, partial [Allocoleopsis sp.]